ncbi:MAG: DinB family protein [Planctomycetota bacterium]|nr:DinB family protein [Planctomycetota bacterium]
MAEPGPIEVLLRQFDDAWGHRWESLSAVLADVTEPEADWQPPGYGDVPAIAGQPPAGCIHAQVAHLAECKADYAPRLAQACARPAPEPTARRGPAFGAALVALQQTHADLRALVAGLEPADLGRDAGDSMDVGEFLAMTIRHDTWHAGQIAVARRLYRARARLESRS